MKRLTLIVATLLLITCSAFAQDTECVRTTFFGEVEICLPNIEGYQECYLDPVFKTIADDTEMPTNTILGYYVSDDMYRQKDNLDDFFYEDFFKVYGVKEITNYDAGPELLEQMKTIFTESFYSENWDKLEEEWDKKDWDVAIGVPVVIKSYELNDQSFTHVMLIKYEAEGMESYTMAMAGSFFLKNKRMICMVYGLRYEGKDTLVRLQHQSDMILTELLKTEH